MTGGGPLPVREYGPGDVARMLTDAAAVKARLFAPRKVVPASNVEEASCVEDEPTARWCAPLVSEIGRTAAAMSRNNYLEAMRDMAPEEHSRRSIIGVVAAVSGISSAEISGFGRKPPPVKARQIAMYLCRELLGSTWHEVGFMVRRDHTSAIFGHTKVAFVIRTLGLQASTDAVVFAETLWSADWPKFGQTKFREGRRS